MPSSCAGKTRPDCKGSCKMTKKGNRSKAFCRPKKNTMKNAPKHSKSPCYKLSRKNCTGTCKMSKGSDKRKAFCRLSKNSKKK